MFFAAAGPKEEYDEESFARGRTFDCEPRFLRGSHAVERAGDLYECGVRLYQYIVEDDRDGTAHTSGGGF